MASLQSARPSSEINPKHKDDLEELKNQLLASSPGANQDSFSRKVKVRGAMLYKRKALEKHDERHWKGRGNFPAKIEVNRTVMFKHEGENGSEAGVIYEGYNGPNNTCGWVLAFEAPGDGKSNKVYVETGRIQNYPIGDETHWNRIRLKLQNSSNACSYIDPTTGTCASAIINERNEVRALFGVMEI